MMVRLPIQQVDFDLRVEYSDRVYRWCEVVGAGLDRSVVIYLDVKGNRIAFTVSEIHTRADITIPIFWTYNPTIRISFSSPQHFLDFHHFFSGEVCLRLSKILPSIWRNYQIEITPGSSFVGRACEIKPPKGMKLTYEDFHTFKDLIYRQGEKILNEWKGRTGIWVEMVEPTPTVQITAYLTIKSEVVSHEDELTKSPIVIPSHFPLKSFCDLKGEELLNFLLFSLDVPELVEVKRHVDEKGIPVLAVFSPSLKPVVELWRKVGRETPVPVGGELS
ncbi:MAG: hypothetical protein QW687_00960 [Candidatus Hadarchaeales archaeon]